MFRRAGTDTLTIWFDGQAVPARVGDSVATALLAAGIAVTGSNQVSGEARGPYCMMGACFACLAVIDGRANRQACMTPVHDGMIVARQDGAAVFG